MLREESRGWWDPCRRSKIAWQRVGTCIWWLDLASTYRQGYAFGTGPVEAVPRSQHFAAGTAKHDCTSKACLFPRIWAQVEQQLVMSKYGTDQILSGISTYLPICHDAVAVNRGTRFTSSALYPVFRLQVLFWFCTLGVLPG